MRRAAAARGAALEGPCRTRVPSRCSTENTTSAYFAATVRPASDWPACTITGRPCGERRIISGPRTWKCLPLWLSMCSLEGSKNRPACLIEHEGVVLEGVPQAKHDLDELGRALVAVAMRRVRGVAEVQRPWRRPKSNVTRFQPDRPPLS